MERSEAADAAREVLRESAGGRRAWRAWRRGGKDASAGAGYARGSWPPMRLAAHLAGMARDDGGVGTGGDDA